MPPPKFLKPKASTSLAKCRFKLVLKFKLSVAALRQARKR